MIVLDTHAWVWWASSPGLLSARARQSILFARRRKAVYISSISAWEVAMLATRGRLKLNAPVEEWIATSQAQDFIRFVPVDNAVAVRAVRLPAGLHADPIDRLIASTALGLDMPLVTRDQRLRVYGPLRTIW